MPFSTHGRRNEWKGYKNHDIITFAFVCAITTSILNDDVTKIFGFAVFLNSANPSVCMSIGLLIYL